MFFLKFLDLKSDFYQFIALKIYFDNVDPEEMAHISNLIKGYHVWFYFAFVELTLCMLGNYFMLLLALTFLFKIYFFQKHSFRNIITLSNSFDPDQDRQLDGPDLGPNCLQRLSTDDKSRHQQGKS